MSAKPAPGVPDLHERYVRWAQTIGASYAVPVGLTPKETVWTLNKARLYRYRRTSPPTRRVPLLLVYALVNKPYIFDLLPGRSFIEFMLQEGYDVFLLDWGHPGLEDVGTTLDDYAGEYLPRAVRKATRLAGSEDVSLLGYCIGGTLAVLYAAGVPDAPVRNLILLSPPLDFSTAGCSLFARWFDARYFDVERLVETVGNIPAELIEVWSQMLKPVENYVGAYLNLWNRLDDPAAIESWQAMHRWVHEGVPFAAAAFRQWVTEHVRENRLMAGTCTLRGRPVRLADLRAPLLLVAADQDHIVPMVQSTPILDAVGGRDKTLEVVRGGHVGIMGGRGARQQVWPTIAGWLARRSG